MPNTTRIIRRSWLRISSAAFLVGSLGVAMLGTFVGAGQAGATVSSDCVQGYCIAKVSGDPQTANVGTAYASPLVVRISQDTEYPVDLSSQQVTFSFDASSTAAHFASGATSVVGTTSASSSEATATSALITPDAAGTVVVDATWDVTPAEDASVTVKFSLTATNPCTTEETPLAGAVAITCPPPPTTPPAVDRAPYTCIGAGCGLQPTTTVPVVVPLVSPEVAPTTAPPEVLASSQLAATGRTVEPLTWAALALIAMGALTVTLTVRRRGAHFRR